jgi:guanylate kinase
VFLSPLSKEEILFLRGQGGSVNLEGMIAEIMRRKLLRRTQRQTGILSLKSLENIEVRARSAYRELQEAHRFDRVVPNHDGEDSENWDAFYFPIGDARRATVAVAALMSGEKSPRAEKWDADVLP